MDDDTEESSEAGFPEPEEAAEEQPAVGGGESATAGALDAEPEGQHGEGQQQPAPGAQQAGGGHAAAALEALQRDWQGVLYTHPGDKKNGRAVGPFGWVGITVDRSGLLRATYKGRKLKTAKRGASGSEQELAAVLCLATRLVEAHTHLVEAHGQAQAGGSSAPPPPPPPPPAASSGNKRPNAEGRSGGGGGGAEGTRPPKVKALGSSSKPRARAGGSCAPPPPPPPAASSGKKGAAASKAKMPTRDPDALVSTSCPVTFGLSRPLSQCHCPVPLSRATVPCHCPVPLPDAAPMPLPNSPIRSGGASMVLVL